MKFNCPKCRKEADYFVLKTEKSLEQSTAKFGELSIKWIEGTAYCKECKTELYIDEIEETNNKNFQSSLKEAQRKNVGFDFTRFLKNKGNQD